MQSLQFRRLRLLCFLYKMSSENIGSRVVFNGKGTTEGAKGPLKGRAVFTGLGTPYKTQRAAKRAGDTKAKEKPADNNEVFVSRQDMIDEIMAKYKTLGIDLDNSKVSQINKMKKDDLEAYLANEDNFAVSKEEKEDDDGPAKEKEGDGAEETTAAGEGDGNEDKDKDGAEDEQEKEKVNSEDDKKPEGEGGNEAKNEEK